MKRTIRLLFALFTVLFLAQAFAAENQSSELLGKIQEEYWQFQLKNNLYLRLTLGYPVERLPDVSLEQVKSETAFYGSLLDRLKKVNAKDLSHDEWLNYELIKKESQNNVEYEPFHRLAFQVTPYASPIPLSTRVYSEFQFKEPADCAQYLKLLSLYPTFIDKIRLHTEQQARDGIYVSKDELALVTGLLRSMIQEGAASQFAVKSERLASVASVPADFQKDVAAKIDRDVNPSLKRLVDFLSGDYQSKAPSAVGLSQYPGGAAFYRYLARAHTTMDVTPEEVHQIGLKRVAELNAQMDRIRESLGFKGTKAEFHKFLKTDPKFIPKTPGQIGDTLMGFVRRIEPELDAWFLRKPAAAYGVKRMEPSLEGSMTFGYYEQPTPVNPMGIYYYNGSNLSERPLYNSGSLIYHELVPGHHFQICLQSESTQLPMFRKYSYHTAFIEGWAEYASGLAGEMGMYRDPYEEYGRLAAEMFLTVRLVVDTGMNALGWPRDRAMQYMRDNLLESETQIQTESLRYSCDIPGQALAYKMGSMKIRELRETAKAALGEKFDIRRFHDLVLSGASLPMTVLEQQVDWYIGQANGKEKENTGK